jgi:hypothetical protein
MDDTSITEEIRWQVMKAMLEQFPTLKEKVRAYLSRKESAQ